MKLPVVPADGTPVVLARRDHAAQRRGGDLEVFVFPHRGFDHPLEGIGLDVAQVVVDTLNLETERSGEVLLVADHHVDILGDLAVHLAGLGLAADRLPERGTVVEIIAHDRAVLFRGLHRLDGQIGGGFRQRGENPAGVEPTRTEFSENVIPIEISAFELRGRGVSAVGHADRPAHAEAALGEVESVAHGTPDAVILPPFDESGIHPALHDEVLDQVPDFVVDERGADRCLQPEAFAQSAGGIVFAAAFPRGELPCSAHAALAGIETQHDLAERDLVVVTG